MKIRLNREYMTAITIETSPYRYFTFQPNTEYEVEEKIYQLNKSLFVVITEDKPEDMPLFDTAPEVNIITEDIPETPVIIGEIEEDKNTDYIPKVIEKPKEETPKYNNKKGK